MQEKLFMEKAQIKVTTYPVDLDAGANTGARVDMQHFKRCTFLIVAGAGTTPSSHTVSFQQHDAASAGTSANLSIDNGYFHRVSTATYFTKVAPTGTAAASFDIDTVVGDTKYVAVFEVNQEDITDGNRWISCNLTDAGGAQLGTIIAICHNCDQAPAYSLVV
jgi:hypothetical protein